MPLLNDQYGQTLVMAKPLDEQYRTLRVDIWHCFGAPTHSFKKIRK